MPRTYAPAQLAYLAARAAYDVAKAEADAHMDAYEALADELEATLSPAEYAAWCEARRNDGPTPVLVAQSDALNALRAAERALLTWALDDLAPKARTAAHRAAIETMRTVKPWQVKAYDGVIDLAMRYDA
jgi:hypothetical protein